MPSLIDIDGSSAAATSDRVCPASTVTVCGGSAAPGAAQPDHAEDRRQRDDEGQEGQATAAGETSRRRSPRPAGRGGANEVPYGILRVSAGSHASALMLSSIPAARATVEPVFDRTSVRVVARMFDSFKTRLEEMFEMCVREAITVLMQEILPTSTDNRPDLLKHRNPPETGRADDTEGVDMARPRNADIHEMPDRGGGGGLTDRQRRVLEVIRNSVDRRGYPPSMREIGEAVGLTSPSSVAHQLSALERKGYLRRDPTGRAPSR